ncbi:MAG: hypothetical protein PWP03_54 [Candidatus Woesearchaeota archaeon]|nr:hypothetical protein [Candidatus Woesearchaeota archaeon]MDN5327416.1 hypothetical protein [Candidatus Woesearchaeota archaeon]
MKVLIIDFYTDEPSGLGVPPYIGTYPRYIYGALTLNPKVKEIFYITVDDLRNLAFPSERPGLKTNIKRYNLTRSKEDVFEAIIHSDILIFIMGVLTPGKYLRAVPGTFKELLNISTQLEKLSKGIISKKKKLLFGPIAFGFGSSSIGGVYIKNDFYDKINSFFDKIIPVEDYSFFQHLPENIENNSKNEFVVSPFEYLDKISVLGARIVNQIPWEYIVELETYRGCTKALPCSFCVEKFKNRISFREPEGIIEEAKALSKLGSKHFRLGKQTSFYDYFEGDVKKIEFLLSSIRSLNPETLHIDNVNPLHVVSPKGETITKLIVKYCTPGNVAALGIESVDPKVVKLNNLKVDLQTALKAVEIINKYGSERGNNGMPLFLPGINLLFGLIGETKSSFNYTFDFLMEILNRGLLVRRVNIREVVPFKGTLIEQLAGNKYLRKNRRYYFSWRKKIREKFDNIMLQRILPKGTILKDCLAEIHDGNHTFLRQFGSYPLVVGVNERLELGKKYDIKVTSYMLRSVTGEVIKKH